MSDKKRFQKVAVMLGGPSSERAVSLRSGAAVARERREAAEARERRERRGIILFLLSRRAGEKGRREKGRKECDEGGKKSGEGSDTGGIAFFFFGAPVCPANPRTSSRTPPGKQKEPHDAGTGVQACIARQLPAALL